MKLHFEGHGNATPWIAAALGTYFTGMALFRWEMKQTGALSRATGAGIAFLALAMSGTGVMVAHAATENSATNSLPESSAILPLSAALPFAIVLLVVDFLQFGRPKGAR